MFTTLYKSSAFGRYAGKWWLQQLEGQQKYVVRLPFGTSAAIHLVTALLARAPLGRAAGPFRRPMLAAYDYSIVEWLVFATELATTGFDQDAWRHAVRQAHLRQIQRERPKVIPMCQEQEQGRRACCACSEHIPRPLREAAASAPTC